LRPRDTRDRRHGGRGHGPVQEFAARKVHDWPSTRPIGGSATRSASVIRGEMTTGSKTCYHFFRIATLIPNVVVDQET
jgi:hypothetical protein